VKAIFHRGLSVPASEQDAVGRRISRTGVLAPTPGSNPKNFRDPSALRRLPRFLPLDDLVKAWKPLPTKTMTYACGNRDDASVYAFERGISRPHGLIVSCELFLDDVAVDPHDFLGGAFRYHGYFKQPLEVIEREMASLYGDAIRPYIQRASETTLEQAEQRFALCDVACCDPDVVAAHLRNQRDIHGRWDTVFRSAFLIPAKVPRSAVQPFWKQRMNRVPSGRGISYDFLFKSLLS